MLSDCGEFWCQLILLPTFTVWYILWTAGDWLWRISLAVGSVANWFDSLAYFTENEKLAMENFASIWFCCWQVWQFGIFYREWATGYGEFCWQLILWLTNLTLCYVLGREVNRLWSCPAVDPLWLHVGEQSSAQHWSRYPFQWHRWWLLQRAQEDPS